MQYIEVAGPRNEKSHLPKDSWSPKAPGMPKGRCSHGLGLMGFIEFQKGDMS